MSAILKVQDCSHKLNGSVKWLLLKNNMWKKIIAFVQNVRFTLLSCQTIREIGLPNTVYSAVFVRFFLVIFSQCDIT